jgi:hypothetical protein
MIYRRQSRCAALRIFTPLGCTTDGTPRPYRLGMRIQVSNMVTVAVDRKGYKPQDVI